MWSADLIQIELTVTEGYQLHYSFSYVQSQCWPNVTKVIMSWFSDDVINSIFGMLGTAIFGGGVLATMVAVSTLVTQSCFPDFTCCLVFFVFLFFLSIYAIYRSVWCCVYFLMLWLLLIHVSIIWIYVMNHVYSSSWLANHPSTLHDENFNIGHYTQTAGPPNVVIPAMLICIIAFYHFILLSLNLTLPGGHRACAKPSLLTSFSHILYN